MKPTIEPLPTPAALRARLPLVGSALATVERGRAEVRAALAGSDERLVVIAGPCSLDDSPRRARLRRRGSAPSRPQGLRGRPIHRADARLLRETPHGVGWKGLIDDPATRRYLRHPDRDRPRPRAAGRDRGDRGAVRRANVDPSTSSLRRRLVSWSAIGARTTESQTHREMASGLSMPVGFKNGTDGRSVWPRRHDRPRARTVSWASTRVDASAWCARRATRTRTSCCGAAARGRTTTRRRSRAPWTARQGRRDPRPHRRAPRQQREERRTPADVSRTWVAGPGRLGRLLGVMLESNLAAGRQDWTPRGANAYGVSVTDGCLGWDETEALLREIAALRARAAA